LVSVGFVSEGLAPNENSELAGAGPVLVPEGTAGEVAGVPAALGALKLNPVDAVVEGPDVVVVGVDVEGELASAGFPKLNPLDGTAAVVVPRVAGAVPGVANSAGLGAPNVNPPEGVVVAGAAFAGLVAPKLNAPEGAAGSAGFGAPKDTAGA
jgi:hypothetical protein